MQQDNTLSSLSTVRLTKEELRQLRNRLPQRGGIINQIAKTCNCYPSKVSRVFRGELYCHKIVAVAQLYAQKHEADITVLVENVRQSVENSGLPLQK